MCLGVKPGFVTWKVDFKIKNTQTYIDEFLRVCLSVSFLFFIVAVCLTTPYEDY
jgi:hypothetical protein